MKQLAIIALAAILGGWAPSAIAQSSDDATEAEQDPFGPDPAVEAYEAQYAEPASGRGLALLDAFLGGFVEAMQDNAELEARLYGRYYYENPYYYEGGYQDGYDDGYDDGYEDGSSQWPGGG